MTIRVCLAGTTGWAGSALARGIAQSPDTDLVAAVSRTHAGRLLGDVLAEPRLRCPMYATAQDALVHPCDVFFEYNQPEVAKANSMAALHAGVHVVIGTSGLTDADHAELAVVAEDRQRGVLAVGNFALTVVLLQKLADIAAKYIGQREIIEYAHADKPDAPRGTARELAARLAHVRPSELTIPLDHTQGLVEARGTGVSGSQVHSIRLPGYTISAKIIFGMPDQKLTIRHDAGAYLQTSDRELVGCKRTPMQPTSSRYLVCCSIAGHITPRSKACYTTSFHIVLDSFLRVL